LTTAADTAAGVLGRTAVVDLTIAVNYDRPVHHVARDIQIQVAAALRNDLGLRAATVNIIIGDILDAAGVTRGQESLPDERNHRGLVNSATAVAGVQSAD